MAKKPETFKPHRILRDIYRHYGEFEDIFRHYGTHVIDHVVRLRDEDGNVVEKIPISISFFDLKEGISKDGPLSERKRQAVMLNVIKDLKQKDAAEVMGVTTVTVGQYVDNAMEQLAKDYFSEFYPQEERV